MFRRSGGDRAAHPVTTQYRNTQRNGKMLDARRQPRVAVLLSKSCQRIGENLVAFR